jgi:hypothetical protein
VIETIFLIRRREKFGSQNAIVSTLVIWTTLQNIVMASRPGMGLLTDVRSVNNLAMALLTHISAALAAGIAILFVYFEINLIHDASMVKDDSFWYQHRRGLLITIAISQLILFVLGPLINWYLPVVKLTATFWTMVILISITVIPYLAILGIVIYRKIAHRKAEAVGGSKFKKLSRHILITVLICTGLATSNCIIAMISWSGTLEFTWFLIELAWIFDIFFNGFIFLILMRKKAKSNTPSSKMTSKMSSNIGGTSEEKREDTIEVVPRRMVSTDTYSH